MSMSVAILEMMLEKENLREDNASLREENKALKIDITRLRALIDEYRKAMLTVEDVVTRCSNLQEDNAPHDDDT